MCTATLTVETLSPTATVENTPRMWPPNLLSGRVFATEGNTLFMERENVLTLRFQKFALFPGQQPHK